MSWAVQAPSRLSAVGDNEPLPLVDSERLGSDADAPSCLPGTEPLLLFADHTRPSVPNPRFCKGGPRVRCKSSLAVFRRDGRERLLPSNRGVSVRLHICTDGDGPAPKVPFHARLRQCRCGAISPLAKGWVRAWVWTGCAGVERRSSISRCAARCQPLDTMSPAKPYDPSNVTSAPARNFRMPTKKTGSLAPRALIQSRRAIGPMMSMSLGTNHWKRRTPRDVTQLQFERLETPLQAPCRGYRAKAAASRDCRAAKRPPERWRLD